MKKINFCLILLLVASMCMPMSIYAQSQISGTVSDANGPLIGVSVILKGTSKGTVTDAKGAYTISVPNQNSVLIYSFIGYKAQEISVGSSSLINVVLQEDAFEIGGVVAIGYGSQRKEDLSTAVSTIAIDDRIRSRGGDLSTILQGRLPGVTVQQSGDPMNKASLSIRGRGSKGNDGDPTSGDGVLIVVDGVPGAPYSTDDIESVTVLKDAASAAIYGASVGSSGVILITTRKAESGAARITSNVSFGFEKAANLPSLTNAQQFCDVWAKAVSNSANGALPNLANPAGYKGANITRTNWVDEIFQTGLSQHYGVSISGGSDVVSSILSVSYDKKQGTIMNTYSEGFSAKWQTEYKLSKWLKVSERVAFDYSNGQGKINTSHTGPILGAFWFPSSASVYDIDVNGNTIFNADGTPKWGGIAPSYETGVSGPNIVNPVATLSTLRNRSPRTQIFSTTSLEAKPISSIALKSDFTISTDSGEKDFFYPKLDVPGGSSSSLREQFNDRFFSYHWENTASWSQAFGKHHISALAGFVVDFEKETNRVFKTQNYKKGDTNDLIWSGAGVSWVNNPTEAIVEYSLVSLLGRIGYSYDDRYFMTASVRRDASSKLPKNNNADLFPSVSGSWKISSEKFFKESALSNIFDLVKIRGGYGKVGNVDLYYSTSLDNIPLTTYKDGSWIGGTTVYGTYYATIPNPGARWETTAQSGGGLDLTMLKRKLDVSVDYYYKETKDLVDYLPIPSQLGVDTAPMGNLGLVTNKGWEFSASYNDAAMGGKLRYSVWGMFSTNKGIVNDYGPQERVEHRSPTVNSQTILSSGAGHPWYSYYVYRTNGIFRSEQQIKEHIYKDSKTGEAKLLQPNAKVGDLILIDTNGDGVINNSDRVMTASYSPKQTFSFGGSLDYKGFDFSFMFQGVAGNYIYNGMKQMAMNGRQDLGNLTTAVFDTWDFNHEGSRYPRLGLVEDANGNYIKFTDIFLEKGDYLRLKNVTLGYTIPKNISRYLGLPNSNIRAYVSVDNALTITGYSGIDPEVGNYGIDSGVYPVSRFYNFGININF